MTKEIFGFLRARSCMIFEARSASRRCTTLTFVANFDRNPASSMAESPPPTTAISLPRKKKPSQVAQVDRPRPRSRFSDSSPSMRADRSEEHTSELQSPCNLVCRLLLEKKKKNY